MLHKFISFKWAIIALGIISLHTQCTYLSKVVHAQTITDAEFFIDDDPGEGKGTALQALDGALNSGEEEAIINNIDTSELSIGTHIATVRFKNSKGKWGLTKQSAFEVTFAVDTIIEAAEFFIDTDPGAGNGTPMKVLDGEFDSDIEGLFIDDVDTSGLSPGSHRVFVRAKDSKGIWSRFNLLSVDLIIESSEPQPASLSANPTTASGSFRPMNATVTVLDQIGQPMSGVTILANTNGRRVTVTPEMAITEADGTADFMFKFPVFFGSGEITFIADGLSTTIIQQ